MKPVDMKSVSIARGETVDIGTTSGEADACHTGGDVTVCFEGVPGAAKLTCQAGEEGVLVCREAHPTTELPRD